MATAKDTAGPIILWQDYGSDGWGPNSFPTIEAALTASKFASHWIITRIVNYSVVEVDPDPLPQTMEASNGR